MAKSLRTDIIIGGKADKTFYGLGRDLEWLGSQIGVVSGKLIDYGKESVETYASYQDAMLDAQVALRTQYTSTNDLAKAMEELDRASLQWASDSRFDTQDVAGAIANAAHAGWDLQKIMAGVPAAMDIALAGSMSLSDGIEYLVDISNAAGLSFSEMDELVDTWAFAANKSSTTIPEMGAAMQKMGATMQFVKGDMGELTTMLAVLADNGAKGTEAGTLLRNSMIRLIAPTANAADFMEVLGMSAEELDEVLTNGSVKEASKMLEDAGYSAYDANGELKSFLTIFKELDDITSTMTEENRNKVLSAIFPTRTITGALALLEAASEEWNGLNESIRNNSEGYAEYAAETMESGVGGSIRHLESVYNALQTRTGGALAEDVQGVTDWISGMIESVNGMDEGKFNGIVGALEAIAMVGPALTAVGGGIKLGSMLLGTGWIGKTALVGTGLAAVYGYLHNINEEAYENNFGDLTVDAEQLGSYLDTLGNSFQETGAKIEKHNSAVAEAIANYTETSGLFKEDLLTKMLTKEKLTDKDKTKFRSLGNQMFTQVMTGIRENYAGSEAFALSLDDLTTVEDDAMIQQIMDMLETGSDEAVQKAQSISLELRDALTSAFKDDTLSSEEVNNIQSILDQYNEIVAEQAAKQAEIDKIASQRDLLRKAQTLGLDGMDEISAMVEADRAEKWEVQEKAYDKMYAENELAYKNGDISENQYNAQVNYLNSRREKAKNAHNSEYDGLLMDVIGSTINSSEFAENYKDLKSLADKYLAGESVSLDSFSKIYDQYGLKDRKELSSYLEKTIDYFGGKENLLGQIEDYKGNGQEEIARELANLALVDEFARFTSGFSGNDASYLNYKSYDIQPFDGQHPAEFGPRDVGMGLEELESQGITVSVDGDVTNMQATIAAEDGQTLTQYIDGDATDLHAVIMDENGQVLTEIVDGNPAELAEAISQYDGQMVTVNVSYKASGNPLGGTYGPHSGNPLLQYREFAEGGRATEASIFGEAGPEWAIPEEHSQRSAELLNAAREASGFTWPELLSRNGGLNAGSRGGNTLIYSPTIVAADATGVAQKLEEDKTRLEKWLKEKKLFDEVEVYS